VTVRATEPQYVTTLIDAARRSGWLVHHDRPARLADGSWRTAVEGDAGFPDLVLVNPRRRTALFIECKRRPNKPTDAQQAWLDALAICGLTTDVWYLPEDTDAALAYLSR
jgi:hypothetical protein